MPTTAKKTTAKDSPASLEDLSAQIEVLKGDVASLTSLLSDYTKTKAADIKETAMEEGAKAQQKAEDFVLSQPTTALGVAALIGFVVGLSTSRR